MMVSAPASSVRCGLEIVCGESGVVVVVVVALAINSFGSCQQLLKVLPS